MKKSLIAVFVYTLFFFSAGVAEAAEGLTVEAKAACLMEAESGDVLLELDPHRKLYPASMTKIMTLLLAVEAIERGEASLDDMVVTSEYAAGMGGSQVWLEPGERMSLEKMLIAIAAGSANDASVAVAEHLAGSEDAFVQIMNERARELGCQNTNFTNSHGLHDPDHYTSAYDMALIAREAVKHPKILELTSIKEYTFREEPKLVLWNTNKLLWWYPGTDGLKTGTTAEAGRNLTSTAKRDGVRLIAVVMGVDKTRGHFTESMKLFNWGFSRYQFKELHPQGVPLSSVRVLRGSKEVVEVAPAKPVGAVVPKGKDGELKVELDLPSSVNAPLREGEKLGEAIVLKDGRELARIPLVSCTEVAEANLVDLLIQLWERIFG